MKQKHKTTECVGHDLRGMAKDAAKSNPKYAGKSWRNNKSFNVQSENSFRNKSK